MLFHCSIKYTYFNSEYTLVGRGFLTPLFNEDPLFIAYPPPLFQMLSNLNSPLLRSYHHPPPLLFLLFFSLADWVIVPYLMCYFIQQYYGSTPVMLLVSKEPCFVFYATRCQNY